MIWRNVSDFVAMGGYALYVWGSVGMFLACLAGEWLALGWRRKDIVRELRHARQHPGGEDA
ncbi:heme exporter protein CcmD [Polaromonas hydrogenivorans]|uniref:Heme exporter protein D n=1 Tax=Polaromonas hydrogenivorans TaxID=335476 RepID=A0AAU7LT04_9BURK